MKSPDLVRTLTILLALCLCAQASAQVDPIYIFDPRLIGSVEADGIHLQVQFDGNHYSPIAWTVTPAGMDVYRTNIGVECGSWERITAQPVPWDWVDEPNGGPHLTFEIVDVTAEPNQGYMYQARAVDAARNPIPENDDAYLGAATHGVALLGHGTIYGGPGGCGQSYIQEILNCSQECFPALLANTGPDVTPYINSETRVLLYGTISGITSFCGVNQTTAFLSTAVPGGCVVSAQEKTWGNIKELYR